jgi:hypothetical protein
MTHNEARKILSESGANVVLDEENGTATIDGELTIEELSAILQLLEYSA